MRVGIVSEVDIAHRFLGEPRAKHFVFGVTDAQAQQHPVVTAFVEALRVGEQQLADPIQRIGLAAAGPRMRQVGAGANPSVELASVIRPGHRGNRCDRRAPRNAC
jgi:hypothetical protein